MFLKRNRRQANGETYEYWSLVRTVRTAKGPRHEVVSIRRRVGQLFSGAYPQPHCQKNLICDRLLGTVRSGIHIYHVNCEYFCNA